MSASSKKKLRREQEAAALTERQQAEQVEARKLKTLTIVFVTVIALVVLITLGVVIGRAVTKSGIRERNTVALTVNDHEVSAAEFNYFFNDAVSNFYNELYSSYGSNAATYALLLYGIDFSTPLDDQVLNQETGETWADYFTELAVSNAKSVYALYDEANAKGHTLTEEELKSVDDTISSMEFYATMSGYSDVEGYLDAMYGYGSDEQSYRDYCTTNVLVSSFQTAYSESLTYDDAALREAESENFAQYSSFDYAVYSLNTSSFLVGGTTDAEGNTTYSDKDRELALTAAENAAKSLVESATSVEALDEAIAALSINEEVENAASTKYEARLYSNIATVVAEWLSDSSREVGDVGYVANVTESTDEEGNVTETTNGYYVVYFQGVNDNTMTMPSVRHLLVEFEGGTTENNVTVYSDEEKAAAKAEAEELLAQWKDGEATEDSFAALATEKTDDTASAAAGGLYEGIAPGQMLENFEDWCFAAERKPGDTGIVETEYGYHIMYFVTAGDTTYRDYMITSVLRSEDMNEWFTALVEAATLTKQNTSLVNRDLVLVTG